MHSIITAIDGRLRCALLKAVHKCYLNTVRTPFVVPHKKMRIIKLIKPLDIVNTSAILHLTITFIDTKPTLHISINDNLGQASKTVNILTTTSHLFWLKIVSWLTICKLCECDFSRFLRFRKTRARVAIKKFFLPTPARVFMSQPSLLRQNQWYLT